MEQQSRLEVGHSPVLRMTILIPTKDRVDDLRRLLMSLEKQTDKNFDVLLVNNGNRDLLNLPETRNLSVSVKDDPTPNLPHLFNQGLRLVNSDVIAYLNDDTEVTPTWIHEIRRTFADYPDIAVVGGPALDEHRQFLRKMYTYMNHHLVTSALYHIVNSVLYEGRFIQVGYLSKWGTFSIGGSLPYSANLPHPIEVGALSVTNMAIRRTHLEKMRGFDELFRFAHADADLFVRLGRIGGKLVFNPRLRVRHFSSPTRGDAGTRSVFWLTRDYILFLRRLQVHGPSLQIRRALTALAWILVYSGIGLSKGKLNLAISSFKGFDAGLRIADRRQVQRNAN